MPPHDPADGLVRTLLSVSDLIRAGDFPALAQVSADLEHGLAQLSPQTGAQLDHLRLHATRNLALLEAAARGVRAARSRMAEVRAAQTGVATYDRSGARHVLPTAPGAASPYRR